MLNQELSAQIRQDLQDARMLLEQSGTQDERKKYRRAAEIILLKTLHLDPENAGGGILRIAQSHHLNPNALAAQAALKARPRESDFRPALSLTPQPVPVSSPVSSNVPVPAIDPVPVPTPARQVLVVRAPAPPPIATFTAVGKLAVSSPIPAEIYAGDRYIGSTPTTLELPAGRQTLEYRHGDLRTAVSHEIKPDETATATVAFSVTLQ